MTGVSIYMHVTTPFFKTNARHVSSVGPVIDHGFRHNIIKVAVDPRGDSRGVPRTTKFIVNNRTDA